MSNIAHLSLTRYLFFALPKDATHLDRAVTAALASHADPEGRLYPGISRICAMCRCDKRSIFRAISRLHEWGLMVSSDDIQDPRRPPMRRFLIDRIVEVGKDAEERSCHPPRPYGHQGGAATVTPGDDTTVTQSTSKEVPEEVTEEDLPGEVLCTATEHPPLPQQSPPPAPSAPTAGPRNSPPRGFRLPPDWAASDTDRAFAENLKLDADMTEAQFRDYWHSQPGARACKLDWAATWRNWCRKESSSAAAPRYREQLTVNGERPDRLAGFHMWQEESGRIW